MKITAAKVKRELIKDYGWIVTDHNNRAHELLISDTLKVVNKILKEQKGKGIK